MAAPQAAMSAMAPSITTAVAGSSSCTRAWIRSRSPPRKSPSPSSIPRQATWYWIPRPSTRCTRDQVRCAQACRLRSAVLAHARALAFALTGCKTPNGKKPTICKSSLRTVNTQAECGSPDDIYYWTPWRAPGAAPVIDSCAPRHAFARALCALRYAPADGLRCRLGRRWLRRWPLPRDGDRWRGRPVPEHHARQDRAEGQRAPASDDRQPSDMESGKRLRSGLDGAHPYRTVPPD
jgi:hypothetical protein